MGSARFPCSTATATLRCALSPLPLPFCVLFPSPRLLSSSSHSPSELTFNHQIPLLLRRPPHYPLPAPPPTHLCEHMPCCPGVAGREAVLCRAVCYQGASFLLRVFLPSPTSFTPPPRLFLPSRVSFPQSHSPSPPHPLRITDTNTHPQLLGETPTGIRALADFDLVSYAGAALPDDLGDRLTGEGVRVLAIYGTTEVGFLFLLFDDGVFV